jgi:exonuclease SbcC
VDFTDVDLVALVGATGAGKSTLIDAITFALYGSVARYDDRKVVAPVINQLSTRARVQLEFTLGDAAYTVARVVQRTARGATTKEARLEHAGDALAADAKAVTAEVTRLLGLDVDQFNRTVVLPQGRFADFLHDNPAERQATLRQLLGFDVYRRIAIAARQRAAAARNHVDALRPELEAARAELTDERRRALILRHDHTRAVRETFLVTGTVIDELDAELASLGRQLVEHEADLVLLDEVRPPADLDALDRRSAEADAAVVSSAATLTSAQHRRQAADDAVADGPDLAVCRLQLRQHEQAAEAIDRHTTAVMELKAAEERRAFAETAAAEVTAAQGEHDGAVEAARAAERAARGAVDQGPDPTRIQQWLAMQERLAATRQAVDAARASAATAAAALPSTGAALAAAETTAATARAIRDELQHRAGIAGYAHLLSLGAPCPLCLQGVHELPAHQVDEDLATATATVRSAEQRVEDHRTELRDLERRAATVAADAEAQQRALDALVADLDGAPAVEQLRALLITARDLRERLAAAVAELGRVEQAAEDHRREPDHARTTAAAEAAIAEATRWRTLEEAERARLQVVRAELAAIPGEAEVRVALESAERLGAAQRTAIEQLHDAERAHRAATELGDEVAAALTAATNALHTARDRTSRLDPPQLREARVAAQWATFVDWAAGRQRTLAAAHAVAGARRATTEERREALESEVRRRAAEVLDDASGPLDALRDRLTRAEQSAAGALATFDERRTRTAVLQARVDERIADREVADELGRLLRADGFEAWLMAAALDELAESASLRLRELSSGQFSLEVADRELMVRDHTNADELRSARTLSGGETFLASLALALALADATSELSSEGGPQIESIFLDEGFGTLDPGTLDVVATTIEELGSAGRMVVVVTHLRELADRIPVRLEVRRDATTSTVERVDL